MSGRGEWRWGQPRSPHEEAERDVDAEIAFHIEARIDENLRAGITPEAARAEAESRFGPIPSVRRELIVQARGARRRRRVRDALLDLGRDVRLAARGLARRPAFTAVAVATLALGIGGNAAVFSLVDSLVLRPPAGIGAAESLARVWFVIQRPGFTGSGEATAVIAHPYLLDLEHTAPAVASIAGVTQTTVHVAVPESDDPRPRRLWAEMVTGSFASTLGLSARLGRLPGPEDASAPRVTAISERLWRDAFGRDPAVVGRSLLLNGATYTVIGVIGGGYHGASFAEDSDLLLPVEAYADAGQSFVMNARSADVLSDRRIRLWNAIIARLAAGATPEEAQNQLRAAWERALEANPISAPGPFGHPIPTVRAGVGLASMGPNVRRVTELLTVLGGVVVFLLLLACANAANLLLVRTTARRGELAVMRAIGAGRVHLARQVLIEALLLALTGAAVGLAVAFGALRLFRGERLMPSLPPLATIDVSWTVVSFSFGLSLLAAALCGALPAILSVRKLGWISAGAPGARASARTSRGLLVFQVAVSFVLLVGAGLMLDTMRALRGIRLGVDPEAVLEATIDPTTQHYDDARARELYHDVLEAASALPSVSVAALSRWPLLGTFRAGGRARLEGMARDDPQALLVNTNVVSPGFFGAVGLELVEGRDFTSAETKASPDAPGVAILSAAAAARLFPEGGAVGRRIDMGGATPRILQVVGVVGDARLLSVKEGEGAWVFEPMGQGPMPWATLLLRGRRGPPSERELEAMIERVDPAIPLYDVQPLTRRVDQNLGLERVLARATALFAGLALLLAGVGIYAVTATAVHGRTRELGVRLALGADRDSVRSMLLWDGVRVAALGVAVGAVAATQLVDVVSRRLWGVQPLDPTVFAAAAGTLFVATALAGWTPAWRATRIDPVNALRAE